jgi:hypothetical protein
MSTPSPLLPTQADVRGMRFGEAFEALFANGAMRPRPRGCTTCSKPLDETKAAYVVNALPIARSYTIESAYDRAACLPERLAPWRERWDGQAWLTIDTTTGEEIGDHPLAVRELDAIDEALLLLAPHQRGDAGLISVLRGYFTAEPEDLLQPEWGRVLDRTTLIFSTGHGTTLSQLLHEHDAHYAACLSEADPPFATTAERLRCFIEESALLGQVA